MNKDLLTYELELLILEAVSKYGISLLPTNYKFLKKYALMELYINFVESNRLKIPSAQFDAAISKHAGNYVPSVVSYPILATYYQEHGDAGFKKLLQENELFFENNPINRVTTQQCSPDLVLEELLISYFKNHEQHD
ncbi:MAG: hypothetical protein H6Q13_3030 [Bacteroidetes bacterium]|nr:hypothetical protein [Bacteroidota bacterium]